MEKQIVTINNNETSMLMNVTKFEHANRVASMLAKSDLVPTHFRGKVANCIIALNLADRMQLDPFMVMQKIYVVHGKPGIESQLAIAVFNNSGSYNPITYEEGGSGKERFCVAVSKNLKTKTIIKSSSVTIKMADDEGWSAPKGNMKSKWVTMPGVMLRYRSAMFLIRQFAPEVIMGMQSKEEIIDVDPKREVLNVNFEDIKPPSNEDTEEKKETKPEEKPELEEIIETAGYSEEKADDKTPPGIVKLQDEVIEKLNFMALNKIYSYNESVVVENTLKKLLIVTKVRENDSKMDLERCSNYLQRIIDPWKKKNQGADNE